MQILKKSLSKFQTSDHEVLVKSPIMQMLVCWSHRGSLYAAHSSKPFIAKMSKQPFVSLMYCPYLNTMHIGFSLLRVMGLNF